MWLEAVQESEDNKERCPTCGGHVHRRIYGEMYAGSFILDGKRVEIRKRPSELFADPVVLDPLTQYFDGGLYRIWPSDRYYSRGGKKLHREVWRVAFGPIPDNCHIHHKDENTANNLLSNLECVPKLEHNRYSRSRREDCTFTVLARKRAAEWHKSEVGRLWHSRHAQRQKGWTKWKRVSKPCLECGEEYMALVRENCVVQKFCSLVCKSRNRRKR